MAIRIIILLIITSNIFSIDKNKSLFNNAVKHYDKKNYNKAINNFLKLKTKGYDNFNINYNLGCSYYLLKDYGAARFYFEKALNHKPFNKDLYHNLIVVNKNLFNNTEAGKQEIINKRIIFFIPIKITVSLTIILLVSSIIMLFLLLIKKAYKKKYFILLIVFIIFSFIFFSNFLLQYREINKPYFIALKTSQIYLSPNSNETVLTTISTGTKGIIQHEVKNFINVKLSDGLSGWIKKNNIIY